MMLQTRSGTSRFRRLLPGIAALLVAAIPLSASALDKLTYNMSWLPQGSVGGTLVAKGKGWFAEAGLDVEVARGYGGQRTVNEVDQGLFDIGYGDPISLVLNRENGGSTVMVGAINTRWPGAICYVRKPGRTIATPQDLKGLTMGGGVSSPVQNIIPQWLVMNGLPKDAIKLVRMDPVVINPALLQQKIDLADCWEGSNEPLLSSVARAQDQTIDWLPLYRHGLDVYGNGFVVTEKTLTEKPDALRRFLAASYKGYAYMKAHPEESAAMIVGQFPTLDTGVVLEQIRQTDALIDDPEVADKGLGWMRDDRMEKTLDFVRAAFPSDAAIAAKDLYTNDLLK